MRHFSRLAVIAAVAFIPLISTVPAHAASTTNNKKPAVCVIHSNPSQVESGNGPSQHSSIADIIQVECQPVYSEAWVMIDATQLSNACRGTLSWAAPPWGPGNEGDSQFEVQLDNDGNAIAAVWGGPSCAPSTSRISASLEAPPFSTVATSFTILPPLNTKPGVTANPKSIVEDSVYSAVATVVQVEFPSVYAEDYVTIKSDELYTRCDGYLTWWGPEEVPLGDDGGEIAAHANAAEINTSEVTVQLDNNGNAFAVAIGGPSCASGKSTITADLQTVPFTTEVGYFKILSPRPTI
jgi:hypothetical protein